MPQGLRVCQWKELGVRDGSSPMASVDTEMSNCRRQILIPWTNYQRAIAELVGYSFLDDDNLNRWLPQEDPKIKGLFCTRANAAHGVGWLDKAADAVGSTNVYQYACLDVDFEPRPYPILSEADITDDDATIKEFKRFVEVVTTPEGEYLQVPASLGIYKWSEGNVGPDPNGGKGSVIPNQPGRIVSTANYTFKWFGVPDDGLPESDLRKTLGRTNKYDFGRDSDSKYFWDAGTLLMIGAGWKRTYQWTPDGVKPTWYVEMMVKHNAKGHTRLYNFKDTTPDWYQVSIDGNFYPPGSVPAGKLIYDEADYDKCYEMDVP